MTTILSNLVLSCLAPAAALLPAAFPAQSCALSPAGSAALHARFDPSLGALRAGRVEPPAALGAPERAELAAAALRSPALADLRAGGEPTNDEWRWMAIGGLIVLLIVLI